MRLYKCILTNNRCYKTGQYIKPKGVMVHSTGANNPTIRRYVQPLSTDTNKDELLNLIGINRNNNAWNRTNVDACVHAFIGKLKDNSVATVQTLPWNMRGWHAGTGTTGRSANNTHISFEICEDGLTDPVYFSKIYKEATELVAMLCKMYNLDPLKDGVVICHSEGYKRGIASGHSDVEHWFPKHGKTMNDFRRDVSNLMKEEDDEDMTQEKFNEMFNVAMNNYMNILSKKAPGEWSKEHREWAEDIGLIYGDTAGNKQYESYTTREMMVTFMHRLYNLVTGKS